MESWNDISDEKASSKFLSKIWPYSRSPVFSYLETGGGGDCLFHSMAKGIQLAIKQNIETNEKIRADFSSTKTKKQMVSTLRGISAEVYKNDIPPQRFLEEFLYPAQSDGFADSWDAMALDPLDPNPEQSIEESKVQERFADEIKRSGNSHWGDYVDINHISQKLDIGFIIVAQKGDNIRFESTNLPILSRLSKRYYIVLYNTNNTHYQLGAFSWTEPEKHTYKSVFGAPTDDEIDFDILDSGGASPIDSDEERDAVDAEGSSDDSDDESNGDDDVADNEDDGDDDDDDDDDEDDDEDDDDDDDDEEADDDEDDDADGDSHPERNLFRCIYSAEDLPKAIKDAYKSDTAEDLIIQELPKTEDDERKTTELNSILNMMIKQLPALEKHVHNNITYKKFISLTKLTRTLKSPALRKLLLIYLDPDDKKYINWKTFITLLTLTSIQKNISKKRDENFKASSLNLDKLEDLKQSIISKSKTETESKKSKKARQTKGAKTSKQ